ncbi:MAG: hypothetical protein FWD17_14555 [Polyangiaceae bacterium]|nr:hypothetical protein [Polyangiaceae bacterium]
MSQGPIAPELESLEDEDELRADDAVPDDPDDDERAVLDERSPDAADDDAPVLVAPEAGWLATLWLDVALPDVPLDVPLPDEADVSFCAPRLRAFESVAESELPQPTARAMPRPAMAPCNLGG